MPSQSDLIISSLLSFELSEPFWEREGYSESAFLYALRLGYVGMHGIYVIVRWDGRQFSLGAKNMHHLNPYLILNREV